MSQAQHIFTPSNSLLDHSTMLAENELLFTETKSSWARRLRLDRMKKRHNSLSPTPASRCSQQKRQQKQRQQQKQKEDAEAANRSRWQSLPDHSKEKVRSSRPVPPRRQRSIDDSTAQLATDPLKRQQMFNKTAAAASSNHEKELISHSSRRRTKSAANASFMKRQRTP